MHSIIPLSAFKVVKQMAWILFGWSYVGFRSFVLRISTQHVRPSFEFLPGLDYDSGVLNCKLSVGS